MLEKCKSQTVITNSSPEDISTKIAQYDSNNLLYSNTVSSTQRTIQSAQRSPQVNPLTMLSQRKSKVVSVNKPLLLSSTMTMLGQERRQRGNTVSLGLYRVITFDNIGKDENGNELLIPNAKDITEVNREKSTYSLSMPRINMTSRGGIVSLGSKCNYTQSLNYKEVALKDLTEYDRLKDTEIAFIRTVIKQYEQFYRRSFIQALRHLSERTQRERGRCKELIRKLRTIQLKTNNTMNKANGLIALGDSFEGYNNEGLLVPMKKRFIRQSFYSKCRVSACAAGAICFIQKKWRKWSLDKRQKSIITNMAKRFPLLIEELKRKRQLKREASPSSLKKKKKIGFSSSSKTSDDDTNQIFKEEAMMIINKIVPYSLSKMNKMQCSQIGEKVKSIQTRWRSSHTTKVKLKDKQSASQITPLIKIPSSLSFITKDNQKSRKTIIHTIKVIEDFIHSMHSIIYKHQSTFKAYSFIKIKQLSNEAKQLKQRHKDKSFQLTDESITFYVKYAYAIGKILSKSIQRTFFYLIVDKPMRNHPLSHSFYYSSLRNHLLLAETFPNKSQREEQSKCYVQLFLCQYFSLSGTLDFYSLYWNDKEKDLNNELTLTNDIFKFSDKTHLATYMTLFINTYYKQAIQEHPNLPQSLNNHLLTQKDYLNTSIFGISRYINDFIEILLNNRAYQYAKCFFPSNRLNDPINSSSIINNQPRLNEMIPIRRRLNKARSNSSMRGTKVQVTEQRIDTFNTKRHIIKVSIERTTIKPKQHFLATTIMNRQMRYASDLRFFNMAKETKFKLDH